MRRSRRNGQCVRVRSRLARSRDQQGLLLVRRRPGEDLALRASHEALAPELETVASVGSLMTNPVHGGHIAAVGHGMRALDRLPGAVLVRAVFRLFGRMPSYGRR